MISPVFTMLIGLPASGKSTYCNEFKKLNNCCVLSSDEYRERYIGDVENQEHNSEIFAKIREDAKELLKRGKDVIIDSTNISRKRRMQFLNYIKDVKCTTVARVFNTPLYDCAIRNMHRERKVPADVIDKMVKNFQMPQYFEGFSEIFLQNPIEAVSDATEKARAAIREDMLIFDQGNPYHKFNLGEHTRRTAQQLIHHRNLYEAALWHDIGKLYTQTYDSDKGYCRYIGHANVSAYELITKSGLLVFKNWFDFLEIIFYVNEHMHIRDIVKSEKAIDKYYKLWGPVRFDGLYMLMNADNIATGREEFAVDETSR